MAGPSIPASQIVSVTPGVLSAGGTALDLSGVVLTQNTRVPINSAPSFPNTAAVIAYFGAGSIEAQMAGIYFLGSTNSTKQPGALIFYQANQSAVAGYVRGNSIANSTLAQLQTGTGGFNISIDGSTFSVSSLNLTSATNQASVATLLQTALSNNAPVVTTFTGAIAGATLTVSNVASGTLAVGQVLAGTGITAGTTLTAMLTGTGANGTYTVSPSQTASSTSITGSTPAPTVVYDTLSGSLVITSGTTGPNSSVMPATGSSAAKLGVNVASSPTVSPGAAPMSYAAAMANLLTLTTNWSSITTAYEPPTSGKVALAAWVNSTNNDYVYAMWDTLSTSAPTNGDTNSAGYQIMQANYSGTIPIWAPNNGALAGAAVIGELAAIDFSAFNGRTDSAFQSAAGLVPDVTSGTVSQNLLANGYNYFGAYATAADQFQFFYNGSITGKFSWIDSYVNQIWLTNQMQLALIVLLTSVKSIPYNAVGYGMVEEAIRQPVLDALNFGAIRSGVTLSSSQVIEVNSQAGVAIDTTLATQGYYIQVLDPGAQVRQARGSPVCNVWYMDGESIQAINLSSIDVQ